MIEEHCFGILALKKEGREWKVLILLHASGDYWGFPKGHAEALESGIEAAIRELKEETALDVTEILSEEPLIERYAFIRNQKKIHKSVFFYPALVQGDIRLQQHEIKGAEWVLIDDAASKLTFDEARKIIPELKIRLARCL